MKMVMKCNGDSILSVRTHRAMTLQADTNAKPWFLGEGDRGASGRIHAIDVPEGLSTLPVGELERRLIELGFTEGATIEILHEGMFGRDPIAVRVNHATVALRRREAMAILVT